jgi:hypothetical protein
MVDAFCLTPPAEDEEPLEETYARSNLKRTCSLARLTRDGRTRAYFLMDQSDSGINLSDLLNSVKVMVVDPDGLTREILMGAVSALEDMYGMKKVPVLVYPASYADTAGIAYDKKYNLWVLSAKCGDDYSEHLKQKAQFKISKLITAYITSRFKKK